VIANPISDRIGLNVNAVVALVNVMRHRDLSPRRLDAFTEEQRREISKAAGLAPVDDKVWTYSVLIIDRWGRVDAGDARRKRSDRQKMSRVRQGSGRGRQAHPNGRKHHA
jgi:hypothetical protein